MRARGEQAAIAEKDLVEANLGLVVSMLERHPWDHIHILDSIVIGNDALMQAVRAFPDSASDNFSAFAELFIERAVEHAVHTAQTANPS
jgi:RNA polymerase primary sigma factor